MTGKQIKEGEHQRTPDADHLELSSLGVVGEGFKHAPNIDQDDLKQETKVRPAVRFGVSKQLGLGFAIVLLLTVLLAIVALRGHLDAMRVIEDVVEGYGSTAYIALQARNDFLAARNVEKEYLLYYRELGMAKTRLQYAEKVRHNLSNMERHLHSAESLLDAADSARKSQALITLILQERMDYEETFFEMVSLFEQRGNHYQGLEFKFHYNMDTLESLLQNEGRKMGAASEHLAADLLKVRKYEQDYLLNQNQSTLATFQEEVNHFLGYVKKYANGAFKRKLDQHFKAYQVNFKRWLDVDMQADLSMQRFDASAQRLESTLSQWYDLTSE
ncbi:MAG: hypothetical protein Q9M19_06695, partial [Mariprofundaceae bacterium]|nr:hypothetical protein [Mariprofundaceae bacterium]